MAENKALAKAKQMNFSATIKSDVVQTALASTLGDTVRSKEFCASLISLVNTNPAIRDCDAMSIISSALKGEVLKLSASQQLGHYYIVPFNDRKNGRKVATFQLGYKGYIQLAIRSGQYRKIGAVEIKEGELVKYDPIEMNYEFSAISDPAERDRAKTIGYYAFFETVNGFKQSMYMTKEQMETHALTYSQAYSIDKKNGTKYSFWAKSSKSFDEMGLKTMLRRLLSKYGILSIDMQRAYENDMTYSDHLPTEETGDSPVYFDTVVDGETGEVITE